MDVIGFKEARCKNCYKCVRTCEVKAITVKNAQAQIVSDKCILCGHCLEACPQNAKTYISELEKVKTFLREGKKTVLSIAPSYLGVLHYTTPGQVISALMKLGFYQVRETAEGAVYVTREYNRLLKEGTMKNIITTSCPSVNDLIEKYYPSLTRYMAPVVSPMIAHGRMIKQELGEDTKVVFLGPCIAKKREASGDARTAGSIDAVINFPELEEWLREEQIDIFACEDMEPHNPNPQVNRLYPISSGVLSSVIAEQKSDDTYRKFYVHGINNCIELFKNMEEEGVKDCFIEANICNGGCIKGSAMENNPVSRFKIKLDMEESIEKAPTTVAEYPGTGEDVVLHKAFSNHSLREKMPSETEIRAILRKIGKHEKEQELNCSACGYATCRDKAIAVYQDKAELNMCIPYLQEKAQSLSNVVLESTPNVIVIVDSDMKIIEFNGAAEKVFGKSRAQALNMYLYEVMDHTDFEEVLDTGKDILGKRVTYEDKKITTIQNIVYVREQNTVLGVFQDVSKEEERKQQAYKVKVETIEMAQKVIDKQMLVAQQIAGLLGETTAETKVTLTKLRDTILFDGEEKA